MKERRPAPAANGDKTKPEQANDTAARKPGKQARILLVFYSGYSLHRFQAEDIGDHCLHSTISALFNGYGLVFDRERVKVPNRFGTQTTVTQYRLAGSSREKAARLLERWRVPV
jgi:hypothetical protein